MYRGASLPRLGDFNQRVILDAIRRRPEGVTRVELAARTGLSAQTISKVTRRLIDQDLVHEVGRLVEGRGKPATVLGLNGAGMYSLGVHLDPAEVSVNLLGLGGEVHEHVARDLPAAFTPESLVVMVAELAEGILERCGVERAKVQGIGLGAPGPLDLEQGQLLSPPLIRSLDRYPLRDELERRLDLPVVMVKDVAAAAVGEAWLSGHTSSSMLFAYWGTGFGVGLICRKSVWNGMTHNAGEAGHIAVADEGDPCPCCGLSGTVGRRLLPELIAQRAERASLITRRGDSHSADCRAMDQIAALSAEGVPAAVRIIDDLRHDLGVALARLTDLLDVTEVVVGGHMWRHFSQQVLPGLAEVVQGASSLSAARRVTVRSSHLPRAVVAVGAAATVFDELLSPRVEEMVEHH